MPASATTLSPRNARLDAMRGTAVLLVVFSHLLIPEITPHNFADQLFLIFTAPLKFIRTGGWAGVDLFFVLSGFLVSGLLFKEYGSNGKIDAWRFLIRRGFKIYPVFYSFLLITFIIDYLLYHFNLPALYTDTCHLIWLYLRDALFLNNYWPGRWSHSWSLDVEEAFYILLVIYFIVLIRLKQLNYHTILYAWLLLMLWGIAARYIAYINHPVYSFGLQYTKSHFRLDALLFGILLSYLHHYHPEKLIFFKRYKYWLFIGSVACLLCNFIFKRDDSPCIGIVGLAVNPVCFGTLLMLGLNSNRKFLQTKWLAYIGRVSYATYLWHVFISMCFITWFPSIKTDIIHWFAYLIGYFTLSLLVGVFFTQIIEVPFLKLRNRHFPAKTVSPGTSAII